ncbi:MAG: LLM class flavin-dependent oxidoreductase [Chloroflexi bacterium]|nr:LLM class flavin-dependent oxidoreductase [Chloroflexota bacterium]
MQVSVFYLPSIGSRAEIEKGMAGLRTDLYQQMLTELKEQAQCADELGYDSISFTEHHFHVEGFEISNNPVMLDLFVALNTKRIRVGQLGIVLPSQNPLRVAEDIAMLDHMSGGRANAGFARGYQRRWVDVMAQQLHGIHGATPFEHDAIDEANRAAFEEHFRIVKQAWTEDMMEFHGKYWQIPPEGTPWTIDATKQWGSGVDEQGIVRQIGVVPKPLQKPHPPIFQPFASSENSIRWCAREEITAILPPMYAAFQNQLYEIYAEEAESVGRKVAPGEGLGVLRDVVVADTDEEALRLFTSQQQQSTDMIRGKPGKLRPPIDDIDSYWTQAEKPHVKHKMLYSVVGSLETVRRGVADFIEKTGADEIIITVRIYDPTAGLRSLEILAEASRQLAGEGRQIQAPTA